MIISCLWIFAITDCHTYLDWYWMLHLRQIYSVHPLNPSFSGVKRFSSSHLTPPVLRGYGSAAGAGVSSRKCPFSTSWFGFHGGLSSLPSLRIDKRLVGLAGINTDSHSSASPCKGQIRIQITSPIPRWSTVHGVSLMNWLRRPSSLSPNLF